MRTASETKDVDHPILAAGSPEGVLFFNKTHIPGDASIFLQRKASSRMARPNSRITLKAIDRFHARGMRLLNALDIRIVSTPGEFSREIWSTKDGRLLVRFKYTTKSDYDEAYEIQSMSASDLTAVDYKADMASSGDDWHDWVPQDVRDAWDEWLEGPFCP